MRERPLKNLLTLTTVIEGGAGVALTCRPAVTVALLLGSPLDTPSAPTVARLAGAALLSLGLACWLARRDTSRAAKGLVSAMVLYNLGAVLILGATGIRSPQPVGIALWPAVVLHAGMTVWCFTALRKETSRQERR